MTPPGRSRDAARKRSTDQLRASACLGTDAKRGYTNAAGGAVEQCPVKQGSAEDAAFIMKSAHTPCGEDWPPRFG